MSLRKLGSETILYGLSSVLGKLLNFVLVTYFITRLFAPGEYGIINILMSYTAFLIAGLVFRMDTALFRFASRDEYDAQAVFRKTHDWVLWAVVILIGTALVFSGTLADWAGYGNHRMYVILVLLTVAFDALSMVPLARLRLDQRPWFFVAVNLGNVLLNIVVIFLLLYVWRWRATEVELWTGLRYQQEYQVGYYLFSITLASAARYAVLLWDNLRRSLNNTQNGKGLAPDYNTLLKYSLPLTVVAIAGIINFYAAPWVLEQFGKGTLEENRYWSGQFSAAMKLAVLLNLFVTAYNYAAEPFFFRQAGKDPSLADRKIYADALRAYAMVGVVASVSILTFLPWVSILIDTEERVGLVVLPLLLAANFMFGMYANFSVAYKLTDKTHLGGIIAAVGSILVLTISISGVPNYGIWAPAWAMFICFTCMCVAAYGISRRYFPVPYPLWRVVGYVVVGIVVVVLAEYLDVWWGRVIVWLASVAGLLLFERTWIRKTFSRS